MYPGLSTLTGLQDILPLAIVVVVSLSRLPFLLLDSDALWLLVPDDV